MRQLTQLLEHFVALIKDEVLQVLQVEFLGPHEGQDTARSADHYVGAVGLQNLLVLSDSQSTEKHADLKFIETNFRQNILHTRLLANYLDARHVFGEPLVLLADLEGQLASVAHDQHGNLAFNRFQLLHGG